MTNSELEQQLSLVSSKMVQGFVEMLDVLSALLGAGERFYETSHSNYVAEKSAEIAEIMGLNDREVFEIRTAGLLHDIGKIALPDTIFQRSPSEMSSEEAALYQRHPELGKEILLKHSGLRSVAEIVAQHHERLDGSGFPKHLRGDSIHIGAQIISVVNVYHNGMFKRTKDRYLLGDFASAINSTSNYLDATNLRYSQILNHLNNKSKTLYNPRVVDVFTGMLETERKLLGTKAVRRISVNQLRPGMRLADNYYTTYGMLVAARDVELTARLIEAMNRFAAKEELPAKILIID